MARQFWQNIHNGEIWAVEVDDDGHVIGNGGPLYAEDYKNLESRDFTEEDIEVLTTKDNEWMEEHKEDFVLYGDERES